MTKRLRETVAAAIAAGEAPRAPTRGTGLLLSVPGGRPKRIIEDNGHITPLGALWYERAAVDPPVAGINRASPLTERGARMLIKLHDGKMRVVRIWDGVERRWRLTQLGKKYYAEAQDPYAMTFPIRQVLERYNGSVFEEMTVLKSTAPDLGEIKMPALMPEAAQLEQVKLRAEEYLASLPEDESGRKVLIEGGGSAKTVTLDPSKPLEYNWEEILNQPDSTRTVSAVLHRPLRAARPWHFGFSGVSPEAFDQTEGRCVTHQLAALLGKLGLEESHLDVYFDQCYEELYEADSEDTPYIMESEDGSVVRRGWREAGVTPAMVVRFAQTHSLAAHVMWGDALKIASYTPADAKSNL